MPSNREWLKDAERVTRAAFKRHRNRKRKKPSLMDAMQKAEDRKAKMAETRAATKRKKEEMLKPPSLPGEE